MKKYLKYFIAILFLIVSACALSSCGGVKQLETPQNLRIENEILSWDPVAHAEGYLVEANDLVFQTKEPSFDLLETILEADDYTIRVGALGDWKKYTPSDPSEGIEYVVRSADGMIAFQETWGHARCIITGRGTKAVVGKLVIPSEIEEGIVTRIGEEAFRGCTNLTAVYIPDTVEYIRSYAFAHCTNLTRVRFSKNIKSLGSYGFQDCGFTEITVPEGIDDIYYAFRDCKALTKVVFPASLTENVNGSQFQGCSALECIEVAEENPIFRSEGNCVIRNEDNAVVLGCKASVIPESAEAINFGAFAYCEGLTEIFIPASITEVYYSFFSTNNLECIEVAEGNPVYRSEGNCIIRKGDNTVVVGCKTSVIPEGVEAISSMAFYKCTGLTKIKIPNSITEIGASTFYDCTSLTEITIPDSVTTIRENAFYNCTSLTEITIPDSVTEIGHYAFHNCRELSVITIPSSVQSIGEGAFENCFASVVLPASVKTIYAIAFDGSAVYTDAANASVAGWDFQFSGYATILWGCELSYDGAYPYVVSWEVPNRRMDIDIDAEGTLVPARAGYEFAGWATEEGGDVVYAPQTIIKEFRTGLGRNQVSYRGLATVAIYRDEFDSLVLGTVLYAVWRPLK